MANQDISELRVYRDKLRGYTTGELEDIYFNINILRHPVKYRLVMMELEARNIRPSEESPGAARSTNLKSWLEDRPFFAKHRPIKAATLSLLLFCITAGATLAMLAPIWVCAMPLHFIGLQTAMVYFACAPIPLILGAGVGGRLGGRGIYGIWVLLGVLAAAILFDLTGAPSAILRSVIQPQGGGGFQFGGF